LCLLVISHRHSEYCSDPNLVTHMTRALQRPYHERQKIDARNILQTYFNGNWEYVWGAFFMKAGSIDNGDTDLRRNARSYQVRHDPNHPMIFTSTKHNAFVNKGNPCVYLLFIRLSIIIHFIVLICTFILTFMLFFHATLYFSTLPSYFPRYLLLFHTTFFFPRYLAFLDNSLGNEIGNHQQIRVTIVQTCDDLRFGCANLRQWIKLQVRPFVNSNFPKLALLSNNYLLVLRECNEFGELICTFQDLLDVLDTNSMHHPTNHHVFYILTGIVQKAKHVLEQRVRSGRISVVTHCLAGDCSDASFPNRNVMQTCIVPNPVLSALVPTITDTVTDAFGVPIVYSLNCTYPAFATHMLNVHRPSVDVFTTTMINAVGGR